MSTTATFNGVTLSGMVRKRPMGPMEDREQHHSIIGVIGTSVISGKVAITDIDVIMEISGFASEAALSTYVRTTLQALMGTTGTLSFSGGATASYTNCKLKSVQQIEWGDQHGPLPNNLSTPGTPWTDNVLLKFQQLG